MQSTVPRRYRDYSGTGKIHRSDRRNADHGNHRQIQARRKAVLLKKNEAKEVHTKLAYAIGKKDPVMAVAIIDGKEEEIVGYDLSPRGIYEYLKLDEVKFADTCTWGHFGRGFKWG